MTLKTATSPDLFQALNGAYGEKAQLQVMHMVNLFIEWSRENARKNNVFDNEDCSDYDLGRIRDMYLQGSFDDVDAGDIEIMDRLLELMLFE